MQTTKCKCFNFYLIHKPKLGQSCLRFIPIISIIGSFNCYHSVFCFSPVKDNLIG